MMTCQDCSVGLDMGTPPRFWRLVKIQKPYLLPYYFCDRCYTRSDDIDVDDIYENQDAANLALVTYLLTKEP